MKTLPPELDAKISEIKSWMFPPGSQAKVAQRARMKETNVSAILNRKRNPTTQFMEAAIEVMNENKARFDCQPAMKVA